MRIRKSLQTGILYIVIIGGAINLILPFVWMISTSLKEYSFILDYPPRLIPEEPSLNNFIKAWLSSNFQQYFKNSLFVASISVILVVLFSAMMAYAFARLEFPGKDAIFYSILLVLMIPNMVGIIPQFLLAKELGLRNSLWGLILFYVSGSIPFNTFLLRGFFETLPSELEDAILIDGGNYFTIFIKMILPLSKPALATVSIFSFLGFWDEYILALTFIDDPGRRTLPVAIATFYGQHATDWGLVFAASLIAVVPVMIVFISMQRYFVGGLTSGAFKG
ncbi:MAG: ABC transporter permease [Chloroflexi bacterium RBG_16_48_8]|nr:MAG: ABC transporter permease [Chloroflexi bacterium RBG_16_48_8]